jgi:hypothetical protein
MALKVDKSSFEPSNCEHHAILGKAHHLYKMGDGVVAGSCNGEAAATAGVAAASSLWDEAVWL